MCGGHGGARGAVVVTAADTIEVPAYEIDVVDTTGCGDAFSAGFLRGPDRGLDHRDAAALGTDHGSNNLRDIRAFQEATPTH